MKTLKLLLLLAWLATAAWSHGEHADGVAKADLQALFPKATSFVARKIDWSGGRRARVEKILGKKLHDHDLGMPVYIAVAGGRSLGMAWGGEADLAKGPVQVVVAVDLNMTVVGVRAPGLPADFLAQFKGQKGAAVGQNLKSNGSAAVSQEVARAVREAAVVLQESR